MGNIKQINIKYRKDYFFNNLNNIENFDSNLIQRFNRLKPNDLMVSFYSYTNETFMFQASYFFLTCKT